MPENYAEFFMPSVKIFTCHLKCLTYNSYVSHAVAVIAICYISFVFVTCLTLYFNHLSHVTYDFLHATCHVLNIICIITFQLLHEICQRLRCCIHLSYFLWHL